MSFTKTHVIRLTLESFEKRGASAMILVIADQPRAALIRLKPDGAHVCYISH